MGNIRLCRDDERGAILSIVNAAAEAYRDVIPADRWREPYMPSSELDAEIAAGVAFWGYEVDGALLGIMGTQPVRDVELIRHAYVAPGSQRHGVGGALLEHLVRRSTRPILVGTWAAADWAIRFYRRHGFEQVSPERKDELLRSYWNIPERQIETSVVLAQRPVANHADMLGIAVEEARTGLREGGIPIGSALFDAAGTLLGRGRNHRVQRGDPSAHAEIEAFRNAGRRRSYRDVTIATTLAPCWLCSGLIRQFGIGRVIVGESRTFAGGVDWLRSCGVEIVDCDSEECRELLQSFIAEHPDVWDEDIGAQDDASR